MTWAAVCFDLYETLLTEFYPAWQPGQSAAQRLGLGEEVFDAVWQRRKQERMTRRLGYRDVLRAACRDAGLAVDEAVLAALYAERLPAKAAPFARVDLGLISNCAVEEVAAWNASRLAPMFDDTVFSYAVGCAKPDTAIYRLACQQLGVAPERCLFVGDGGSDELAGAQQAGLTAYRATWYLERWPAWRQATPDRARSAAFPELRTLDDLMTMVSAACDADGANAEP